MPLYKKGKYIFVIMLAMIVVNCTSSQKVASINNNQTADEQFKNIITLLSSPQNEEVAAVLNKWSDYIEQRTSHSNIDYLNAIAEIELEYGNAFNKWNECYKNTISGKKSYSSSWIQDLEQEYNLKYIKNNRDAILLNMQATLANDDSQCKQINALLLYNEGELFAACKHYFSLFVEFNETLEKDEKKALKTHMDAVVSFLLLINKYSVADLLFGNRPPERIYEIEAKKLNPELYSWFKEHVNPEHFDSMRAAEELDKITGYDN